MKNLLNSALILLASYSFVSGQESPQPASQNDYYQIFLENPVQKINKVTYYDDSGAVEYKLSPDGKAVYLLDYKGEGGVKAEVVNMDGTIEEVIRSKCKIHSLQEL